MVRWRHAGALLSPVLAAGCAVTAPNPAPGGDWQVAGSAERCQSLVDRLTVAWSEPTTRLVHVVHQRAGLEGSPPGVAQPRAPLPAHCDVTAVMQERTGVDGQAYAIRFHLRLPDEWNGRFLMQGGGGTNGELGDAIGRLPGTASPALAQGFAVLSQDSGHDNARNTVPERNGSAAFGFDPQARADYGGDSLEKTALAARALIAAYYRGEPRYSYFYGCSKGGQEGMALAQQYPTLFDGIVAAAPGFSLPRAAIGEAWNTQAFASVLEAQGRAVTPVSLGSAFSPADLALVGQAVLAACDADDGLADGIVGAFRQCTSAKVIPALTERRCSGAKAEGCLSGAQIEALVRIHQGARSSDGTRLYAGFPWDAGWADPGWRIWMLGAPDGTMPAINVAMGGPALASVFSSPPRALGADPAAALDYVLRYDFDRDPAAIDAVVPPFSRSAWADNSARSSDLDAFRARGGKLIVPHGVSDPVFSINDTIAWWEEVDRRYGGGAADFARVFPVAGMGHCQGGPATDRFDAFGALVDWVEHDRAPASLPAMAGPASPWPGRERPLCPYPQVARPAREAAGADGAAAFECVG